MASRRGVADLMAAAALALLLLLLSRCSAAGEHRWEEGEGEWRPEEEEGGGGGRRHGRGMFVLDRLEKVVESEGGRVHVVRGQPWPPAPWAAAACRREGLMHIGFIAMEPRTLFVPQYVDANLILFVQRGEVKVGWIHKDELVERKLKMGDILHIDAGSTFYLLNTGKGQRLNIICSIDASESIGFGPYQSFFIGGAGHPTSVLAGFDPKTLATAFNCSYDELARIVLVETRGPIVYYTTEPEEEEEGGGGGRRREPGGQRDAGHSAEAGTWRPGGRGDEDGNEQPPTTWSWRKLVSKLVGGGASNAAPPQVNKKGERETVRAPEPYNLFDHEPGFRNTYGWSVSVDKHAYEPLDHSDVGVYFVNLTAGSMMAPHVNPRATEYGVVVAGEGVVQVVFPNGSLAMSATVRAGDVFWIPRYFPFCQVASLGGTFEFFGFTTSARRNRPQFLAGASSVLRAMLGPELAAGFGVPKKVLRELVMAQPQAVILPSSPEKRKEKGSPEWRKKKKGKEEWEPLLIKQVAKE